MRKLKRELLLAQSKKVTSERFAALNANVTAEAVILSPLVFLGGYMDNIKIYQVDSGYVDYLSLYAPHLFHNKKPTQKYERKYIGIILHINKLDYFAPLSSFKDKHKRMKESLDFLKIKNYAVVNLNNMFPVPEKYYTYVNISNESNLKYKSLLLAEYRFIKSIQNKIRKNAVIIYKLKNSGEDTSLTKRCNDFMKLEELSLLYKK